MHMRKRCSREKISAFGTARASLRANGWSIASHTMHHQDLTGFSLVHLNYELYWSRKYLRDNGLTVNHLALPFGAYNGLVLGRSQAEPYQSVRSTDRGVNPPRGLSVQRACSGDHVGHYGT